MKKYFKIFELHYEAEETFRGYSDGYGKEHIYHPKLKAIEVKNYDDFWVMSSDFDTLEDAENAIARYGHHQSCCDYSIQTIYKNED